MSTVGCFNSICTRNVKHVRLIKNCYPKKEGEKGPRSSELSYLTFYASSRPAKLTKVGRYLDHKIQREISKGQKQYIEVSLAILKALIQSCHHDLNLFSKWIIRILNRTLDTRDSHLVELSEDTFVTFCHYHDGSTLGLDPVFRSDFEILLGKFAYFCNYTNEEQDKALRMQYIGHRALQAEVTSSALHGSDFITQLDIILPALLETLLTSGEADLSETSTSTQSDLNSRMVEVLASQTSSIFFSKSNGTAVRMALNLLYQFTEEKNQWWPPDRVLSVIELILDSVQPQYRYLLISETMQRLQVSSSSDRNYLTSAHASQIAILNTILNDTKAPLVGVSVLEVLNTLFTMLLEMLQNAHFRSEPPADQNDTQALYEFTIHDGILHSLAGLAAQNYYQNQLDDMMGYFVAKLCTNTTLEQIDGLPIQKYRQVVLLCLDQIVSTAQSVSVLRDNASERGSTSSRLDTNISMGSWTTAIPLLTDKTRETRIHFARLLAHYLEATSPSSSVANSEEPLHLLTQHNDILFVNTLHHTIVEWVQDSDFTAADARAICVLLYLLTCRFGIDATVKSNSLLFKLQVMVRTNAVKDVVRQRAIAAAIVEWFTMIADFYHISSLGEYMSGIRDERIQANAWPSFPLNGAIIMIPDEVPYPSSDLQNQSPVQSFVDRDIVVEMLTSQVRLRDSHDRHGLELESKLYAEWGTEAFASSECSLRIRTSQDLKDNKPKLASPLQNPELKEPIEKKETIKVENLKEALAGTKLQPPPPPPPSQQQQQQQHPHQKVESSNSSASGSDSVPSDTAAGRGDGAHSRRSSTVSQHKADINTLLNTLHLNQDAQRGPLKEKFVGLTELLFRGVELYEQQDPQAFWDAYLILPVNVPAFIKVVQSTPEEQLLRARHNISKFFEACLDRLHPSTEASMAAADQTRQQHAMQLLSCLMRQLFLKKRLTHFNIIQMIASGLDRADEVFSRLARTVGHLLEKPSTRSDALLLAISLVTGNDNVNQNNLNGYFMQNDLSNILVEVIVDEASTIEDLRNVVMLWGLLENYNKYEIKNPYTTRLARCKNSIAFEKLYRMCLTTLDDMTSQYIHLKDDSETLTQSVVSYMASWFSGPSISKKTIANMDSSEAAANLPPYHSALLLVLYDVLTSNPHYTTIMLQLCAQDTANDNSKSTLIGALLSYASYLFEHNRNPRAFIYTRLMLTTILNMTENPSIMNYMIKEESKEYVRLCRQRPTPLPAIKKPRSLFCLTLDVVLIFLKHNIKKKLDIVTYSLAFSCIHRVLLCLKNRKIRLEYHWTEMWPIITATLHFIATHISDLELRNEFDMLVSTMMDVINLCASHGEAFLSDTLSYDTLYYEIIRASEDINTLATYVSRTTVKKAGPDRSPALSPSDFTNVKLICNHFNPILDEWQTNHKASFHTPEKVIANLSPLMNAAVIKDNYSTLELKPVPKADQHTPYNEISGEMGFFRQVLRTATTDYIGHVADMLATRASPIPSGPF
ncbi:hypothetical protein BX666DRAFT_2028128 [Dichotomocladium elegans]|nr:hypothetical protein BX666DRAFT_2028128 [Dichotomocladium elegans]